MIITELYPGGSLMKLSDGAGGEGKGREGREDLKRCLAVPDAPPTKWSAVVIEEELLTQQHHPLYTVSFRNRSLWSINSFGEVAV